MKKYALLLLALIFMLFCACSDSPKTPAEQLLGADDAQLVQERGEGVATEYEYEGKTLIMQRRYDEGIFGLDAYAEYMYSDAQQVNQIVFTFEDASLEQVLDAATQNLGEPKQKNDQTADLDFMVLWEKGNVTYTLRTIPNAGIYLLIESK